MYYVLLQTGLGWDAIIDPEFDKAYLAYLTLKRDALKIQFGEAASPAVFKKSIPDGTTVHMGTAWAYLGKLTGGNSESKDTRDEQTSGWSISGRVA